MKNNILDLIRHIGRPMEGEEILEATGAELEAVKKALEELSSEGRLIITRRGKAALPEQLGLTYGRVQCSAKGYGFFIPADGRGDMFITAEGMNGALHGDMAFARPVERGARGRSDRCEIAAVAKRASDRLTGTYERDGEFGGYVIPDDPRVSVDAMIPIGSEKGAKHGDKVVARILQYPASRRPMIGEIAEILGKAGEKGMDILSIIRRLELPDEFSSAAIKQARAFGKTVSDDDIKGRRDYRGILTVTIDGADAKDLDDAVSLEITPKGLFRLGVHIADVSHYVRAGGAIDKEAYKRGTSVYFPDRVLPMLPKELSNGLCSLNPNEDKLTLSCIMDIDRRGRVVKHSICESVICSDRRLTYEDVNAMFEGDRALREQYRDVLPMLMEMRELMGILRAKRNARGAIDFDLPEAKIILDNEGRAENVKLYPRGEANRMIEEFMLAANETVARHGLDKDIPLMYRVHHAPEDSRIEELNEFLHTLGYGIRSKGELRPGDVRKTLLQAAGSPEENVINRVTLRAMSKARYSPDCEGHFGLAAECYCHFTSPIRRYPDLMVHRAIKDALHGRLNEKKRKSWLSRLPEASNHCSDREIAAVEAERAAEDLKKCEYMRDRLGEEFDGIISGVVQQGFFVELPNTVEGLVRVTTLLDDRYFLEEKHHRLVGRGGRQFRLGDAVRVKAVAADMETGRIDFELCEEHRPKERKKNPGRKKSASGSTQRIKDGKIAKHKEKRGGSRGGREKGNKKARRKP
ncbi:MAG: ribonuclease R [Clostridia bacterium]|nr:ribonuclease R [Clostridia bacterium]